jgi:hypothetical protein
LRFHHFIEQYEADVFVGTESWLTPDIADAEVFPRGYQIFRRDRTSTEKDKGGGIFIGVKDACRADVLYNDDQNELLWVKVALGKEVIHLAAIYRAPDEGSRVLCKLEDKMNEFGLDLNCSSRILIAGDLNLPSVQWDSLSIKHENRYGSEVNQKAIDIVKEFGLVQAVLNPTRGDNILDVFLLRPAESWQNSELIDMGTDFSDHKAVLLEIQLSACVHQQSEKLIRLYGKTDASSLASFLRQKILNMQRPRICSEMSVENLWQGFLGIYREAEDRFVPKKKCTKNTDPVWFNSTLKSLKRKCRKAYRLRNTSSASKRHFNSLSQLYLRAKQQAESAYLKNIAQRGGKDFYLYVNSKRKSNSAIPSLKDESGGYVNDDAAKANLLNEAYARVFSTPVTANCSDPCEKAACAENNKFIISKVSIGKVLNKMKASKSPGPDGVLTKFLKKAPLEFTDLLYSLFKASLSSGKLPSSWREATVVPIFKKGARSEVTNYRPVSLTSIACKIMEHLVADYIKQHLERNAFFIRRQHGFRESHSCETQLVSICQDLADSIDKGEQIDAILLDFSKAFDMVPHDLVLKKMKPLGLDPLVTRWVEDFLKDRTQRVRVGNTLSEPVKVVSGVPQGSVLGPLLFLIFINDISDEVKAEIRLFADDCIIYKAVKENSDGVAIQESINAVLKWCKGNRMKLNSEKSQLVQFTRRRTPFHFQYKVGSTGLKSEKTCKYLGVTIANDINWRMQVEGVVSKANRTLNFISRVCKQMNKSAKEMAYKSLVRPLLEYACTVWDPWQIDLIKQLEKVQNRGARFVLKSYRKSDSVSEMIRQLGWEPLASRRKNARLGNLFKAVNHLPGWEEIGDRLTEPNYIGRNDHAFKIREDFYKTNVGYYSYVPRTVRDWNALPDDCFHPYPLHSRAFLTQVKRVCTEFTPAC